MSAAHESTASNTRPSHARFIVVGLAVSLAMITYLDRACISELKGHISQSLSLSTDQMSWVFFAFAFAYAAFEIPTAAWADRRGVRNVLSRIVLWWSAFTIATATAFSYVWLLVIRFLFGAGEAGAWPSVARAFSRWVPTRERGTIQGIFFMGAHFGGGITPLLVTAMLTVMPWRAVFVVFGLLGVVWAAVWFWWFRDEPAEHPAVNEAELAWIENDRRIDAGHGGAGIWRKLFTHPNMLPLCVMYFPNSFTFYFCITWWSESLKDRGLTGYEKAFFTGLPLLLSVVADLFGGLATDKAAARWGLRIGRCGVGSAAYFVAAACMFAATLRPSGAWSGTLVAIAVAASMFTLGASWGACLDMGGKNAGVLSATMNTSGQIGSMVSPLLINQVQKLYGWNAALILISILFLIGAVSWLLVDPRKRVFE